MKFKSYSLNLTMSLLIILYLELNYPKLTRIATEEINNNYSSESVIEDSHIQVSLNAYNNYRRMMSVKKKVINNIAYYFLTKFII